MIWIIIALVVLGVMTLGHYYALERIEKMHIKLLEELIDKGVIS